MDNTQKEQETEKKGQNTEYLPTKCRITRPPPPKPATNPMQFVKVAPCPLYQKAQEQIKKVEEIKTARKEIREEAEDWQQNLDNWKSSRRKRQEHIIERVVEVKKLEQEGHEKSRRRNKTFSEMLEERNKGRHKYNIPVYNDDDANDLSDYGIGSSSSKTNSIKDVDTDDNSSVLDEKDFPSNKESSASNQSQSEDEVNTKIKTEKTDEKSKTFSFKTNSYTPPKVQKKPFESNVTNVAEKEQYTYEGAIEDYRLRIRSKINIDESVFNKPQDYARTREEVESVVPKGNIFKRKEIFEVEKPAEVISESSRRLSETFTNTQSIKERLKSLEQCTDQSLKGIDKGQAQVSVKERLLSFSKQNETDTKNNNNVKPKPPIKIDYTNNNNDGTKEETNWSRKENEFDRSSSPETEVFMNKLNMFNRDLNLMFEKPHQNGLDDFVRNSTSSELMTVSSDREDSGIHTADVSCAVSQSDEPYEDTDASATIPKCIEKLSVVKEKNEEQITSKDSGSYQSQIDTYNVNNNLNEIFKTVKEDTATFLELERNDSGLNLESVNREETKSNQKSFPPDVVIYENVEIADFIFEQTSKLEPPKVKPPPPPPEEDEEVENNFRRINSTKRIKKEIHIKRSSFLGLDEPTDDQIDPDLMIDKPPDINSFLQKESRLEKSFYKKLQGSRDGGISEVESQDSGLDIERGRLSSDTWCSSLVDSSIPAHDRQDSEQTSSFTSEEDEIIKKEREIIELVEKEEKSKDSDYSSQPTHSPEKSVFKEKYEGLGSEKFDRPFYPSHDYQNDLDEQDSEVLRVEAELKQLEREEFERQRENILFREKLRQNRRSLENICDTDYAPSFADKASYRKSMPDLQRFPLECRNSLPDVPNYKPSPEIDYHRKSMPDIQHAYNRSVVDYCGNAPKSVDCRKSMPELQQDFRAPPPVNRQSVTKPLRLITKDDRFVNPNELDSHHHGRMPKSLTRHSLHALSAVPKPRHNDNWIQPKANSEPKSYNQHWLYQEAELRRISEQKNPQLRNNWQQPRQEYVSETMMYSLGQNRSDVNAPIWSARREHSPNKEYLQHQYPGHQTYGHAQPMSYPPPMQTCDNQDKMLSVSGKKKCSNCGNELGRGAAMIIESLCLFYHMECFKCYVCHMRLGDGRMGTDVRVRNQKLHCHNCYSSEDGVKFSCV